MPPRCYVMSHWNDFALCHLAHHLFLALDPHQHLHPACTLCVVAKYLCIPVWWLGIHETLSYRKSLSFLLCVYLVKFCLVRWALFLGRSICSSLVYIYILKNFSIFNSSPFQSIYISIYIYIYIYEGSKSCGEIYTKHHSHSIFMYELSVGRAMFFRE